MALLVQLDMSPLHGQVAIVDATWQDYPQWETGQEWVAYRAPSLVHPDRPPYPGVAVATQSDIGATGPQSVCVEVWSDYEPKGLRWVHETVLYLGNHGVDVGNFEVGESAGLTLARGEYPLQVWVDADTPEQVSRVVFVLGPPRQASVP
ncbi:hypothetical protein [Actinopolymorpha alba]|uniref:hypothetical protein n=1 Tax=Actinopolymorpha alba TaxID=533267 RepID=UPI0003771939|nr:hypothetical protein [Actinopolymorpha alba]